MTPLLILLLVYSVALVATGAWIGRSVRKSDDFFVGGRSLGAGAVFATFLAANIGAASTVNATGLAYHHGLAAWWWNGAAGLGTLVLEFVVGPRIWALATARGYLTVGDFLDDHFGRQVRLPNQMMAVASRRTWRPPSSGSAVSRSLPRRLSAPPPCFRLRGACRSPQGRSCRSAS